MAVFSQNFSLIATTAGGTLRDWWVNPGQSGSFWVQPFQTTAQWITSGSVLTQLRNGNNGSPTGYVHTSVTSDFVVPYWVGTANDPLVPVSGGGKTVQVHIPVGAVTEQPYSGTDSCIYGADRAQPYLIWTANNAVINTGSIQSSGSSISCGNIQLDDGSGPIMCDQLTQQQGWGNGYGTIQDYELTAANADPNYVIQHMLTYNLDPSQVNTSLVWPLILADQSFADTGSVTQGYTIGIPLTTARPTGRTRGFYVLFDVLQQFGMFYYNVAQNGCISMGVYHTSSSNAALASDIAASFSAVLNYVCILSNQSGLSSLKGFAPGGTNAFPAPPRLDFSPTGGSPILPSKFGAWYPSGYNTISTG